MNTPAATPRRRAIFDIPHKQASEIRWVDVPARPGVGAHRDPIVTTACGAEIATTLVTRINRMVKCPDCRLTLADDTEAAGFWLDQLDRLIAVARYLVVHGENAMIESLPLPDREWLFGVLDCGNDVARVEMYDAMCAARGAEPEVVVVQPSPDMLAQVTDLNARFQRVQGDGDDLDS